MKKLLAALLPFLFVLPGASAQDTLQISPQDFIEKALDNSGQMAFQQTRIDLAGNRVKQASDQRWLPQLSIRSEHGVVPGVTSPNGFPEDQVYLDPEARNDWDQWGLMNRVRLTGVQPLFTWNAINKAVEAARIGVKATQQEVQVEENKLRLRLVELYYSYVFALEVERLIRDAEDKIAQIEKAFENLLEDSPEEVDESDRYKLRVFKSQFDIQKIEVQESLDFIRASWNYLLRNPDNIIYEPSIRYLEKHDPDLLSLSYYQNSALLNRPELRGLEYGKAALDKYISSLKSQNLPGFYLGFSGSFASSPVRPQQSNPFVGEPYNTNFGAAFGVLIRQNLNFFQIKTNIERTKLERRKVATLKDAATDAIMLEVNDAYRNAVVAVAKVEKTNEALVTTKEWLRMEQLDYDFGFGEGKDLIDAMKQELELRLKEFESLFELKTALSELNKSAGLPLLPTESN